MPTESRQNITVPSRKIPLSTLFAYRAPSSEHPRHRSPDLPQSLPQHSSPRCPHLRCSGARASGAAAPAAFRFRACPADLPQRSHALSSAMHPVPHAVPNLSSRSRCCGRGGDTSGDAAATCQRRARYDERLGASEEDKQQHGRGGGERPHGAARSGGSRSLRAQFRSHPAVCEPGVMTRIMSVSR